MKNIFNIIVILYKIFLIFIIVWFTFSYIDVLIHNTNLDGGTILANWNFFKIIMQ